MAYGKRGVNWGMVITAIILAGIVLFFGFATEGFKNWDPKTWFQNGETKNGVLDENGNNLSDGKVHELPEMMVFRSGVAESASASVVNLEVNFEPADADYETLEWLLAWKNPNSAWATGKSIGTYFKVTPTADNTRRAKVECLQSFGESIDLMVVLGSDPTIKVMCAVEYSKRLTNVTIGVDDFELLNDEVFNFDMSTAEGTSYLFEHDYVTSEGTLADSYKTVVTVQFAETFYNLIKTMGIPLNVIDISAGYSNGINMFKQLFTEALYNNRTKYNNFVNQMKVFPLGIEYLQFNFTTTGKYSSHSKTIIAKKIVGLKTRVASITIDSPTLVF